MRGWFKSPTVDEYLPYSSALVGATYTRSFNTEQQATQNSGGEARVWPVYLFRSLQSLR
jgi:hypothetical protein